MLRDKIGPDGEVCGLLFADESIHLIGMRQGKASQRSTQAIEAQRAKDKHGRAKYDADTVLNLKIDVGKQSRMTASPESHTI